jgi:uncharacterized iron-regulated protein
VAKFRFSFLLLCVFFLSMIIDRPAYRLFDVNGKKTTYDKMIKDISQCQVVLFGEMHDNPISHWLELKLTQDLFKIKKQNLILGAEMFEARDQRLIDKYLTNEIAEDTFRKKVNLWKNYETDYKPLLEFARDTNLQFIATNVARKYAGLVMRGGFSKLDTLSADEKKYIAPLPLEYDPELEQYKKMLTDANPGHSSPNLPKAQALKDATMAYFINQNLTEGKLFLHFNGSYHSDFYEGIMWYLKRKNSEMRILTIATVEQTDISKLTPDNFMAADYIICVPDDMTKTY